MPFYFAWCGPGQPFDNSVLREDEVVFAFDIAHLEGQVPTLSIDIKNPHIGLLNPGRSQWAWLSYLWPDEGVFPLFYGRLVALPSNLLAETVTLQFLARPSDYLSQKQTIANSLMYEPFYDPIWIDPTKYGDPDTVLETYAVTWHVDRTQHVVSVSDIVFGEDGTEEFKLEDLFYDSVAISFAQSPQTQVVFDGTVQWTQTATGIIPLPDVSLSAWNGAQIISDWPKVGDQLRNGWSVYYANVTNYSDQLSSTSTTVNLGGGSTTSTGGTTAGSTTIVPGQGTNLGGNTAGPGIPPAAPATLPKLNLSGSTSFHWVNQEQYHNDGDTMEITENATYDEEGKCGGMVIHQSGGGTIGDPGKGTAASGWINLQYARLVGQATTAPTTTPTTITITNPSTGETTSQPVTVPSLFGQLWMQYDLSFGRTEVITFVMTSDVQPIVLLPTDEPINQIKLSMHGQDLGLPIDAGGTMPIQDPSRSVFFPTDRGMLAIQYPMLIARATLAQAARATKVNFDCTFERAMNLSCRKNALLHDLRLPGGQVIGKITEYHLKADGDKGELIGSVQIESTIGNGSSIVESDGTPTYADDGYVTGGYQFYSNASIALPTGDANIVMPSIAFNVSQMVLPLTFNSAVLAFQVHQGTPVETIIASGAATADPTWLEIVLMPVTGQKFETDYSFGYSTLVLPKLIDLAAPNA